MPVAEDKRQRRELADNSSVRASRHFLDLWCRIAALCRIVMPVMALLLLVAAPSPLSAQGLGDEVILSRLGDPVEIEISLKDWQHLDMPRVKVTNASPEQYASFKLTYLPLLDSLNFNVVGPNLAGEVKILVSSRKPVTEPYMDLLLVMKWPEGSSMREYVLLFDPPLPNFNGAGEQKPRSKSPAETLTSVADRPAVAMTVAESASKEQSKPSQPKPVVENKVEPKTVEPKKETKPEFKPDPKPKESLTKTVTTAQPPDVRTQTAIEVEKIGVTVPAPVNDGRRQYRVRSGDSLWTIARQFHPAGIGENLYQFLISLHDLNREAFINGNISLLKADAPLHIPSARDIAAINPGSAQKIFDQLWRDGVRSPDLAVAGDAPLFKPLNEADVPKPPPAPAPKLPPGTEKQNKATASSSPLLPAPTGRIAAADKSVAPTIAEAAPATPPVPTIQVVPQQTATAKTESAVPADANPFMQKINQSATAIQGMLEIRQQRLQALEQQILAMQTQLQQAQSRASELTPSIEQRRAEVTSKAIQLGLLAALLLILLGTTIRFALKWNHDIQRRQKPGKQAGVQR